MLPIVIKNATKPKQVELFNSFIEYARTFSSEENQLPCLV